MKKHAASDKICENTNAAKTPDTNTENSVKKHSTVKLVTSILSIAAVITVSAFAAPALGKNSSLISPPKHHQALITAKYPHQQVLLILTAKPSQKNKAALIKP